MLGIIIYLQIDRSVSADEFLMVIHIREPGAQANRALSMSRLDRADGPAAVERVVFVGVGAKQIIGSNFLARLET